MSCSPNRISFVFNYELTSMKCVFLLLLTSFCIFPFQDTHAQTTSLTCYKLFVHLENAPFDSLYLQDYTLDRNIIISGKKNS